jgi:hypothetical protein
VLTPFDGMVRDGIWSSATADAMAAVLERQFLSQIGDSALVLGGSLGFGLANAFSDVDLVVITTSDSWESPPPAPVIDGLTIHGTAHLVEDLERRLARLRAECVLSDAPIAEAATRTKEDARLCLEVLSGPVVRDSPQLRALRAETSINDWRRGVSAAYAYGVSGHIRDSVGAWLSGDAASALEAAARCLDVACSIHLCALGRPYGNGLKFIGRRLREAQSPHLEAVSHTRQLLVKAALGPAVERALRNAWYLAAGLVHECLFSGAFIPDRVDPSLAQRHGPRRTPSCSLVPYAGNYLVMGDRLLRLSPMAAELWSRLSGRSLEDLVEQTTALWQRPTARVRPYILKQLDLFRELGLIDDGG